MSYVFDKPAVCNVFPAIGGGAAFNPDAFEQPNFPSGDRVTRTDADVIVSSAGELPDDYPPGSVVWLESDAVLDVGGRQFSTLNRQDVTLASGRGIDGSDGALVRTSKRVFPQFPITGDGCRVTGVRFEGPEPDSFGSKPYASSGAIAVNADNVEIDNCVVRGYTFAGITVGNRQLAENCHIHHSDLVDCNSTGLGYGVVVYKGNPLIRACYTDNNRHAIAGGGGPLSGWRTVDCIGGEHSRLHDWDEHEDDSSAGDAGTRMVVKRCVLLNTHNWYGTDGPSRYGQEAIYIRGIPRDAFVVRDTLFAGTKPTEPMRDHANDAFNVRGADTFAEGKVEGVDSNVYEWVDGSTVPSSKGPTRDASVTGYGGDSGSGDGGGSDDPKFGPPMTNPTSNRGDDEQFDVTLKGTGNVSQYALTAKTGVAFPRKEESEDRIEGRTAHGQLSTLDDVVRCTGPITALAVTSGDPAMRVEIDQGDGETYTARDFPDRETATGTGTVEATLTVGGSTYTLSGDVTEQ